MSGCAMLAAAAAFVVLRHAKGGAEESSQFSLIRVRGVYCMRSWQAERCAAQRTDRCDRARAPGGAPQPHTHARKRAAAVRINPVPMVLLLVPLPPKRALCKPHHAVPTPSAAPPALSTARPTLLGGLKLGTRAAPRSFADPRSPLTISVLSLLC